MNHQCFVCLGAGGTLVQTCACTECWVHPACFARLVTSVAAHAEGCPVCKAAYRLEVSPAATMVMVVDSVVCLAVVACVVAATTLAYTVWYVLHHVMSMGFSLLLLVITAGAAFASVVNLLHFLERAWAGRTQGHRVKFWCNEERIWVRLHPRALRVECKW